MSATPCPRCGAAMEAVTLDSHLGRPITIDLCQACQAFWFDAQESLRLSPGSTLELFHRIGRDATAAGPAKAVATRPPCPRCGAPLRLTKDMQRNTRFEYDRCPAGHGRLTTFFNFLREKNFVKPMTAAQIAELRRNLRTVNCSNCGAPVDLTAGSICAHCQSPLSILDMTQARALVEQLQAADRQHQTVDPALPLAREQARRETAAAFDAFERDDAWMRDVSAAGLVGAGLQAVARWINRR
ncbi:MAG: zf-TFIIB domain-containing protein [Vicinamibacterales bacterium]